MRFSLSFAVLLACVALPLFGADPPWFEITSQNFLLYTDTTEVKGRRLITDLEARFSDFGAVLGEIPQRQFPIEVFLFGKPTDFLEAAPRNADGTDFNKSAYLVRGPDRIFVVARDKAPEDIANDVGHALGHVLFERYGMWRPYWLAEGAAEYFRKVGRSPDTKKVSDADVYPVADLFEIVPAATYDDDAPATTFRVQAHRLFRLVQKDHRSEFRDFLAVLKTPDGEKAILNVDTEALDKKLSEYVETRINPATVPALQAREAVAATLAIHRGDLLTAARKTSEAAMWYSGDSKEARGARAILGRFSRSGGEPIRLLERAARDLPELGLVQFHFGSIETQTRSDQELQVAALQRAIQLLPKLGRAQGHLARVYVQLGTPEKALPEIDRALVLEPEFADQFFATRAEAYLAMSKFDDANKAITSAAALPHTDRGVNYALKAAELAKRVAEIRREGEARRLAELRSQVDAQVAEREPPRLPPPPPPPPRSGGIEYEVQARVAAQILMAPLPVYPDALIQKGAAGSITVQVNVGADGRVTQATIVTSQFAELNPATLDAVKKWTFKPVTNGGRAVPFDARVIVRFTVQ